MDRRRFLLTSLAGALTAPLAAGAQQPGKVYRIGVLSGATQQWLVPMLDAFRQGLLDLGYAQAQIIVHVRYSGGRDEALPRLAAELVSLKVDVIVIASSTPAALAARQATTEIPIVMVGIGAAEAVVRSVARPGGNITGSTILGAEVSPKRLELVKELRPGATQVALLWNPENPANVYMERALKGAAQKLNLKLVSARVRDVTEFDPALDAITKQRVAALIVTGDPMHQAHIGRVIDFAARHRLPAIYNIKENVLAGGLMSYGADHRELYRRAAIYVDKIVKGTKPGDLPIEQPTKFEFVINLKTAKALGLTIPPSLLLRADQVIE